MRKVRYAMSVSLDGFIEATDGDLSWTDPDEELLKHFIDQESAVDTVLYGRRMYENMASYWPTVDEDSSLPEQMKVYARIWKDQPKVVFSKTLKHVAWNSRLASGDIVDEVNKLKEQPGKTMSVSGSGIASTFMQLGLIDEYRLYMRPVILGGGKPMFRQFRDRINLQLVETRTFGSGVVLLRYQL